MERGRRVALGMSGGVDSAVSAALLARAGYEVVGVTCVFQRDDASSRAVRDAAATCARLGLEHVARDCTAPFEQQVIEPFVRAYAEGLTPSPCVGCNAHAKMPALLQAADDLGCASVPRAIMPASPVWTAGASPCCARWTHARTKATCCRCCPKSSWRASCCRWGP